MKIYLTTFLAIATLIFVGCSKKQTATLTNDFDLSGFSISDITPFLKGGPSQVTISSPNLKDGTYKLRYTLYMKSIFLTEEESEFNLKGGKGMFETRHIDTPGGVLFIAKSLIGPSKVEMEISATKAFSDSTGLIDATINGVHFRATHVIGSTNGQFILGGAKYTESNFDQTLDFGFGFYYANGKAPVTVKIPDSGWVNYNMSNSYQSALSGQVVITATNPHLMGTFSFITWDSSIVSGTFMRLY